MPRYRRDRTGRQPRPPTRVKRGANAVWTTVAWLTAWLSAAPARAAERAARPEVPAEPAPRAVPATHRAPSALPAPASPAEPELDPPLPDGRKKRPVPSYSSRCDCHPSSWLWLPRALSYPLYVVTEYGIRRPLWALSSLAEEHHLRARVYDLLTFGDDNQVGVFPTGTLDSDFHPRVGVYFFYDNLWGPADLKLRGVTGGSGAYGLNVWFGFPVSVAGRLALSANLNRQPDRAFHGLGPEAGNARARYDETLLAARLSYSRELSRELSLQVWGGVRRARFDADPEEHGDASIAEAIARGDFPSPPGLQGGYAVAHHGVSVLWDSRPARVVPRPREPEDYAHRSGSGVVLGSELGQFAGLARSRAGPDPGSRYPSWLRQRSMARGALDLTGTRRTLELELALATATPLGRDGFVPFTEQIHLGGFGPLRGFRSRRLTDLSAASVELSYRWPIWPRLDGVLHYAVGNVFGEVFDGFRPNLLRSSFGISVASVGAGDQAFEAIVAAGTETFESGSRIESVRFAFGTHPLF